MPLLLKQQMFRRLKSYFIQKYHCHCGEMAWVWAHWHATCIDIKLHALLNEVWEPHDIVGCSRGRGVVGWPIRWLISWLELATWQVQCYTT